jgi:hypothetical protein
MRTIDPIPSSPPTAIFLFFPSILLSIFMLLHLLQVLRILEIGDDHTRSLVHQEKYRTIHIKIDESGNSLLTTFICTEMMNSLNKKEYKNKSNDNETVFHITSLIISVIKLLDWFLTNVII